MGIDYDWHGAGLRPAVRLATDPDEAEACVVAGPEGGFYLHSLGCNEYESIDRFVREVAVNDSKGVRRPKWAELVSQGYSVVRVSVRPIVKSPARKKS